MSYVKICRQCFQPGHTSQYCLQPRAIACNRCYRLNFFTTQCCDAPEKDEELYHQAFRLSKTYGTPHFFIDLDIFGKNVPALISTGITTSRINYQLLMFAREQKGDYEEKKYPSKQTLIVPIRLRNFFVSLECEIMESLECHARIELGQDFLRERPHTFMIERQLKNDFKVHINIGKYKILALIHTGISQSIIDEALIPIVYENKDKYFVEYENPRRMRVVFTAYKELCVVHALVGLTLNYSTKVILGMDFLKRRDCTFKLDNITVNTLRSWITNHHDRIEYVHQHEKGAMLKEHMIYQGFKLPNNYYREPIVRHYAPEVESSDDSF